MIPQSFIIFTIIYITLIIIFATIAYQLDKKKLNKNGKEISIKDFLNNYTKVTLRVFMVGLVFGVIFGIMDNLSLFFGIEGIGKYLEENFHMNKFQIAGYSNAYSGTLGITFATFGVLILKYLFPDIDQDKLPVWLNGLGFLVGSILGIYIPIFFMNRFGSNPA